MFVLCRRRVRCAFRCLPGVCVWACVWVAHTWNSNEQRQAGKQSKAGKKEETETEKGKRQRGKRGRCKKLQGRNEREHLSGALQKTTRNVAQNYSAHCLAAKQTKANWRCCWGGKAEQAKETERVDREREREEGISRCIALMLAAFSIEFAYTWLPPKVAQSAGLLSRRGGWAANRIRNRNETHKQTFLCLAQGREEQQRECGKRVQYLVAYTQCIATILELRAKIKWMFAFFPYSLRRMEFKETWG